MVDGLIVLVGVVLAVVMLRCWPRPDADAASMREFERAREALR